MQWDNGNIDDADVDSVIDLLYVGKLARTRSKNSHAPSAGYSLRHCLGAGAWSRTRQCLPADSFSFIQSVKLIAKNARYDVLKFALR